MLPQIEKAIYCSEIKLLKDDILSGFKRIYYGNEFCEHLIPELYEVEEALNISESKNIAFTFVSPFVTDSGIEKLGRILYFLNNKNIEIVINDFGVLELIKNKGYSIKPVLGRLLNRQKRGPRIEKIKKHLPRDLIEHLSYCHLDRGDVAGLLCAYGISRVELDNLPLGLRSLRDSKMDASLYYPYAYISTTRLCPTAKSFKDRFRLRLLEPCNKECKFCRFYLYNRSMGRRIILKGNSYFIYQDKLPDNLGSLRINRLVFEPEIPI
ncbi:MAG: hypothetical protein PHQ54_03730 [Candidatus Omnitrophica bacterium]|nr:hypothetical protein [Candidatus Omnitrophota bacterium]